MWDILNVYPACAKNYGVDMKTWHNQNQCRSTLISCGYVYTHMYTVYVKYLNICKLSNVCTYTNIDMVFLIWFLINKFYAYDLKCCISMHHLDELLREYDGFLIWN